MIRRICLTTLLLFTSDTVFAAEAGMPQLDPTYWVSQVFWLTIIFSTIYFLIAKIFVPKIKANIDARENQIRKDIKIPIKETKVRIEIYIMNTKTIITRLVFLIFKII